MYIIKHDSEIILNLRDGNILMDNGNQNQMNNSNYVKNPWKKYYIHKGTLINHHQRKGIVNRTMEFIIKE